MAATGTINLDGTVGDVGGVAQKTVAVRKAGAQLFLVPRGFDVGPAQAGSMKVYSVATLQQALRPTCRRSVATFCHRGARSEWWG